MNPSTHPLVIPHEGVMAFDKKTYRVFVRRTGSIYQNQKRRLKDTGYEIHQFRKLVEEAIGQPCPFCETILTAFNFSADHSQPVSRGGSTALDNLEICCERCNQIKGMMTGTEFFGLMDFIRNWEPKVKINLLARLRAGGRLIRGKA